MTVSTKSSLDLSAALSEAVETENVERWENLLKTGTGLDPVAALRADPALEADILKITEVESTKDWLKLAEQWYDGLHRTVRANPDIRERVLWHAWAYLRRELSAALRAARMPCRLPDEGGVLAFVDGVKLCLVVRFEFFNDVPKLSVIDAIPNPRSAFDVVDELLSHDPPTRNELKRMLQSSHRLVWHRGVLGHVDRREEPKVFGPSIDTLILAEYIASEVAFGASQSPTSVLEVGTGSGFILAGMQRNMTGLRRLIGIDVEIQAATATHRNLKLNSGIERSPETAVVVGPLQTDLFGGNFDLVVCNPPYIPEPAEEPLDRSRQRTGAVLNLDLLDQLLNLAAMLVAPGGSMLILVSSVTPPSSVRDRVPSNFELSEPFGEEGREVLFEVEEVFGRPAAMKNLLAPGGGLKKSDGNFTHKLHAMLLTREDAQ